MQVSDLVNKHEKRMGFVIGAGPSLHFQDLEPLKEHITIATNSALQKVTWCNYFLSDDWACTGWDYFWKLKGLPCTKLFYDVKLKNRIKDLKGINKDEIVWYSHRQWHPKRPDCLLMSKDPETPIIGSRTSAGSAVNFAYLMGCDPIVLLGCDCCHSEERHRYYWQYSDEKKCRPIARIPLQLSPTKRKGEIWTDSHSDDFLKYWGQLARQSKKQGINIINASGGIMDSFPRMKLEEVLEKYA
jgi:hypothetical protein